MPPTERKRVVIDTAKSRWEESEVEGHARLDLYSASADGERVTMERLRPGVELPEMECPGGEEIFVLSGDLGDDGLYRSGTWIRTPPAIGDVSDPRVQRRFGRNVGISPRAINR